MATSPAAMSGARPVASRGRWSPVGCDGQAVWGSYRGSGAEPYDVVVDHVEVAFRCSCPSRRRPCKHALGLLLLWAGGHVPPAAAPPRVEQWMVRRRRTPRPATPATPEPSAEPGDRDEAPSTDDPAVSADGTPPTDDAPPLPPDGEQDRSRDERVERMMAGLVELDRWLDDRIRTGLADPALAVYSTWDDLAARLVDARAGSLANRVRRLAGLVGASPEWHADVLEEIGLLHLVAQAGRRLGSLPDPLADAVATSSGWQVKRADVLAGVPDTDLWVVAGRSDTREDRIEVRRHWLRGLRSGRWALLLSFAAFRQSLDSSWDVGTAVEADLHRYPGPALRALGGLRHAEPVAATPPSQPIAAACDEIGRMLVAEPWSERLPTTVSASLTTDAGRWALTDPTGSLPLTPEAASTEGAAVVLAHSAGRQVDVTVEWTPHGVVPLTVHLDDRSVDVGPRADASFVVSG